MYTQTVSKEIKQDVNNLVCTMMEKLSKEQRIRVCGIIEGIALAESEKNKNPVYDATENNKKTDFLWK